MKTSLRILIAEDEYLCLVGLVSNVKKLGHEVIGTASDGKEAVKIAIDSKPDMIITDINMPVMNGIDAIKEIQKQIHIPSILVSGYHDEELIDKAAKEGIYSYLIKPINIWDIAAAIKVSMGKFYEIKEIKTKLDNTERSLKERKYIEKAKGILMDRNKLCESDAMEKLQKMSKNNNKKMIVVAKEIIKANEILG